MSVDSDPAAAPCLIDLHASFSRHQNFCPVHLQSMEGRTDGSGESVEQVPGRAAVGDRRAHQVSAPGYETRPGAFQPVLFTDSFHDQGASLWSWDLSNLKCIRPKARSLDIPSSFAGTDLSSQERRSRGHRAAVFTILGETKPAHGGHGTSRVPAWNRGGHGGSFWARTLREKRRLQRPVGRSKSDPNCP